MSPRPWQDPNWTEISASLRKGTLYVKMQKSKASSIVHILQDADQDLLRKKIQDSGMAFVFSGSTDDWNEDLITLKKIRVTESSGGVEDLIQAVEAGLRNEPRVDWISRIGGPPRDALDALESLFGDEPFSPEQP